MRKSLQIVVTAVALVTCLAFIALWVRSNSFFDELWIPVPFGRKLGLLSLDNCASVTLEHNPDGVFIFRNTNIDSNSNLRPKTHWGFLFVREPGCTYGYVPFWFLIASAVGGAAAPWLSWRFSLRTLLIVTTLIAIALGLVVGIAR
jgi:hypothetical protein